MEYRCTGLLFITARISHLATKRSVARGASKPVWWTQKRFFFIIELANIFYIFVFQGRATCIHVQGRFNNDGGYSRVFRDRLLLWFVKDVILSFWQSWASLTKKLYNHIFFTRISLILVLSQRRNAFVYECSINLYKNNYG